MLTDKVQRQFDHLVVAPFMGHADDTLTNSLSRTMPDKSGGLQNSEPVLTRHLFQAPFPARLAAWLLLGGDLRSFSGLPGSGTRPRDGNGCPISRCWTQGPAPGRSGGNRPTGRLSVGRGPRQFYNRKTRRPGPGPHVGDGTQVNRNKQKLPTKFCRAGGVGPRPSTGDPRSLRRGSRGGKLYYPTPEGFYLLAPSKLGPLFRTKILSWPGKVRAAMELFIPPRHGNADESLASFVRRRFGREVLDRLAQPIVAGIYSADPEKLSLQATFPRFLDMEKKRRSDTFPVCLS